MNDEVWTAEEVAKVSAEALRLAEELRPVWPDELSGGHTTHRYDPATYRCICGALDHPDWGVTA